MTSVSVVINTLNRCGYLEETLLALRNQTHPAFEVLVVNGPSTDGTAAMLAQFARRCHVLSCDEANLGVSRNIGVQHSAGSVVAFIDDDAIPASDWLEQLAGYFKRADVCAVGGPVFDVPLNRVEWQICTSTRLGEVNLDSPPPIVAYQGVGVDPFLYLAGCNMAFRRPALRAIGGFNPMLKYGYDDVDVCLRLIDRGYFIEYADKALVRHIRATNSTRDEERRIVDPYLLLVSRSIFAMQNRSDSQSPDHVLQCIKSWEQEWIAYSSARLASNVISEAEHLRFVGRATAGAAAGALSAGLARPFTTIGQPPAREFLQYH